MNVDVKLVNENIICFYGGDWWYHNPHSAVHIMRSFAKDNRVLFVNSVGIRVPNIKTDVYAWKKIIRKINSMLRYFKKPENNIYVLSPVAIPSIKGLESSIERLNKILLIMQLSLIIKFLNFKKPIVWVNSPIVKNLAIYLRKKIGKSLVYYCVDNTSYIPGANQKYIANLEKELHESSDLTLFVNHQLLEERKSRNRNTFYLGHGVDYAHFAKCQGKNLFVPDDIGYIKPPIVGYMGVIEAIDFKLVQFLADNNKDISFVFIGETQADLTSLKKNSNIHFLGKKNYDTLPNYLQKFDVCCLFYETNDMFNKYRNPKKFLEYLATGKPVVSVDIFEMRFYKDYVLIGSSFDEFNKLLHKAIYQDTESERRKRIGFAQSHTWDSIAGIAATYIQKTIS